MTQQPIVHLDFETRGTVDLKKTGVDVYARDPTTDVLCVAWAASGGPVCLWTPDQGSGDGLLTLLGCIRGGATVVAHNAAFEAAIWNHVMVPRYGWPELPIEQMRCTMAMAYAMSLPGALVDVAPALGLHQRKDDAGHRVMLQLCKPRKIHDDGTIEWWDDLAKYETLYEYCKADVEVERAVYDRLLQLSPKEQKVWFFDHKVNQRGIYVDKPALEAAHDLVSAQKKLYNAQMRELTNNAVATCDAISQLADWLRFKNVPVPNGVSKAEIVEMLNADNLDGDAATVLRLRQEAGKTSTAKLSSMIHGLGHDGRIRGTMQYHAAGTGRWGGRRIQPQNYPRQKMDEKDITEVFAMLHATKEKGLKVSQVLKEIDVFYGPPMQVLSECLRTFIMAAPGNDLIGGDFSNIEGRTLAWLAGEEWKLDAFRAYDTGTGHDIYKITAGGILGKDPGAVDKEKRQGYGKVPELALGYGGGVEAFRSMAVIYGVDMAAAYDTICEISPTTASYAEEAYNERGSGDKREWVASEVVKLEWRRQHPAIVRYWDALEYAASNAILNEGQVYDAGPEGRAVKFRVNGSFLWCLLPSGRVLCYPYPKIQMVKTPWGAEKEGITYMGVDQQTRKWVRQKTYGGKLAENITQAVARDVLVDGMGRVEFAGYPVVLHVHDEAVCEVPRGFGSTEEFSRLMATNSTWNEGLPIAVDGWRGQRYEKR